MSIELAKRDWHERIDLVKKTVAIGATDVELELFLYQAKRLGLDPLSRQIHFVKRKRWSSDLNAFEEVGTVQVGIDGFRVLAERTGKLAGIKRGVLKDDKGQLLGGWAEVYRTDWTHPAREEVSFTEYCQTTKDGKPMGLWGRMPETMIKKVAEAAALRMAFPADLSGIYADEEMPQETVPVEVLPSPKAETPALGPSPEAVHTETLPPFNYTRFWAWAEMNGWTPPTACAVLGVRTMRDWVNAGGTEEQAKSLLLKKPSPGVKASE